LEETKFWAVTCVGQPPLFGTKKKNKRNKKKTEGPLNEECGGAKKKIRCGACDKTRC